jgi:hypothetical protein
MVDVTPEERGRYRAVGLTLDVMKRLSKAGTGLAHHGPKPLGN